MYKGGKGAARGAHGLPGAHLQGGSNERHFLLRPLHAHDRLVHSSDQEL